jgi:hypothetical protein
MTVIPKGGTNPAAFGQLAIPLALTFGQQRRSNFRPYCGIGLDEQVPLKLIT